MINIIEKKNNIDITLKCRLKFVKSFVKIENILFSFNTFFHRLWIIAFWVKSFDYTCLYHGWKVCKSCKQTVCFNFVTYSSIRRACAAVMWLVYLKFSWVVQQEHKQVFFDMEQHIDLDVSQFAMHQLNFSKMSIHLYEESKCFVRIWYGLYRMVLVWDRFGLSRDGFENFDLHRDGPPSLIWNKIFLFAFVWSSDFYQDTYLVSSVNTVFDLVTEEARYIEFSDRIKN